MAECGGAADFTPATKSARVVVDRGGSGPAKPAGPPAPAAGAK